MYEPSPHQLDACLERIVCRGQGLQGLNLAEETDRRRALEESRKLLGVIVMFRQMLEQVERRSAGPQRLAA